MDPKEKSNQSKKPWPHLVQQLAATRKRGRGANSSPFQGATATRSISVGDHIVLWFHWKVDGYKESLYSIWPTRTWRSRGIYIDASATLSVAGRASCGWEWEQWEPQLCSGMQQSQIQNPVWNHGRGVYSNDAEAVATHAKICNTSFHASLLQVVNTVH